MRHAHKRDNPSIDHVREIEIFYSSKMKSVDLPQVRNSEDAYGLFFETWDKGKIELQEQFRVMLLNSSSRCMGIATVTTGGLASCEVDLKLVFAMALKARARNIIVAHNHPSGSKTPSESDKTLTNRFHLAGRLLELPLRDHLIITTDGYSSLADDGLLYDR